MREIMKWEWRYCKKSASCQLLVQMTCLFGVFLLYYFWKEGLFQFIARVFVLPEEVYAFTGLNHNAVTGNCLFYILFAGMYLNVWMAWNACSRTLYVLQADEQTGSIYTICNQWHTKKRIGYGKILCSLSTFWGQNTIWHCVMLILALAGSVNGEQRINAVGVILRLWFQVTVVVSMLIVLTFCAGSCCRYPMGKGLGYVNAYFAGSLIAGNLYKVRDLGRWVMAYLEMPVSYTGADFQWLDFGYWLSPLSWLNPFAPVMEAGFLTQAGICIIVAAAGFFVGERAFCRRRFCAL